MDTEDFFGFISTIAVLLYGVSMVTRGYQIFKYAGFSWTIGQNLNEQNISKKKKWKQASKAFGVRVGKLKKMGKDEIKKLYRKKVMKEHPDHGGNADKFRNLHEAYQFAYNI